MSEGEIGRAERLAATGMRLVSAPSVQHTLDQLGQAAGVARSTMSEDMRVLDRLARQLDIGRVETVPGKGGGVRYIPAASGESAAYTLTSFAAEVRDPGRILPGGFLQFTDLVCSPEWSARLGVIFATSMRPAQPTHVLTVETRGIPLALMTAHALGLPLLIARRDARVAEGPALSISYLSATTGRVQNMSLPRRSLRSGARVLVIDDFMRGGGTARGLIDLVTEFDANIAGVGVAIATAHPAEKKVGRFLPLLVMSRVDEGSRWVEIDPNVNLAWSGVSPAP